MMRKSIYSLLLFASVTLAWAFPDLGKQGGALHAEHIVPLGVMVIFFAQGLLLPLASAAQQVRAWRLHIGIQLCIFGLVPGIAAALLCVLGPLISLDLRVGILFLAVLPTTLATAVAFTSESGGAVTVSLLNTVVSNLLGVVFTPLAMTIGLQSVMESTPGFWPVLHRIALLVIVPLAAGIIAQPLCHQFATTRRNGIQWLIHLIIFFSVFSAFAQSFATGVWSSQSIKDIAVAIAAAIILLTATHGLFYWLFWNLLSRRDERIAAFFCSAQKTIAAGVPMAYILFDGLDSEMPLSLGLVLLPLMVYHPLQLFIGGILVEHWRKQIVAARQSIPVS